MRWRGRGSGLASSEWQAHRKQCHSRHQGAPPESQTALQRAASPEGTLSCPSPLSLEWALELQMRGPGGGAWMGPVPAPDLMSDPTVRVQLQGQLPRQSRNGTATKSERV